MSQRVTTIGAAVQDVFLQGKVFTPKTEEDGDVVEEFALGSKNEVESVIYSTGGGATNAAVTFARQGLDAAYLGKTGQDFAGHNIRADLEKEGVDISQMSYSELGSGFSALLLAPNGERTILTYRGASTHYDIDKKQLDSLQTDWIYLSSLDGNFDVIQAVLLWSHEHSVKVVWNPGKKELEEPDEVKSLLPNVTILSLNKDEMQTLFEGDTIEDLASTASLSIPYVVVTDGPNGVAAADGKELLVGGLYEDVPVIDRTGAGDAFCSGFAAALIKGGSLREAITLGSANSTSVVGQIGAKAGILKEDAIIHDMPIESKSL